MWPFKKNKKASDAEPRAVEIERHDLAAERVSSEIKQRVEEALAPGVVSSVRKNALNALRALPQTGESLRCYSMLALDVTQVRMVRVLALESMALLQNEEGTRALLNCVDSDLRSDALSALSASGMCAPLHQVRADAVPMLHKALQQIVATPTSHRDKWLIEEIQKLSDLLKQINTPESVDVLIEVDRAMALFKNRLVPEWLKCAMTNRSYDEVKNAIAALKEMRTLEAEAALETFRGTKSRLIEKYRPEGVGGREGGSTSMVYTSEFGQPKSDEEITAIKLSDEECLDPESKKTEVTSEEGRVAFMHAIKAGNEQPACVTPIEEITTPEVFLEDVSAGAAGVTHAVSGDLTALVHDQLEYLKTKRRTHLLAPVAFTTDLDGGGSVLTFSGGDRGDQTPEENISTLQQLLREKARNNEIRACAVFYHGNRDLGQGSLRLAPVAQNQQADCVVGLLDDHNGHAFVAFIPYHRNWMEEWEFGPIVYQPREREIFACGEALWLERIVIGEEVRRFCKRGSQLLRDPESSEAEAETCFDRALELDAQCGDALIYKSAFLRTAGRYEEAIEHCDRAAALDAANFDRVNPKLRNSIWRNKALALHALGRFNDEIDLYEQVIASGTANDCLPELWNLKGGALASCDVIGGALVCFDEAGRLGHPHAVERAIQWLRDLADNNNHVEAKYHLGRRYYEGKGLKENHAEAVHWFVKAAEQGHADAQRLLGICYHDGDGVPQDMAEARKWIRSADALDAAARKAFWEAGSKVMKTEPTSVDETIDWNIEEGGSVFETLLELIGRFPDESRDALRQRVIERIVERAGKGEIAFYLERRPRAGFWILLSREEGIQRLQNSETWTEGEETYLVAGRE